MQCLKKRLQNFLELEITLYYCNINVTIVLSVFAFTRRARCLPKSATYDDALSGRQFSFSKSLTRVCGDIISTVSSCFWILSKKKKKEQINNKPQNTMSLRMLQTSVSIKDYKMQLYIDYRDGCV